MYFCYVCSGLETIRLAIHDSVSFTVLLAAGCCQVSTKSGLDPSGVWQAWGLASLVAGNLSGAREKLGRCLKPPMDRKQLNLGPLLLQDVIRHLENDVPPTVSLVGGTSIVVVKSSWCLNSLSNTISSISSMVRMAVNVYCLSLCDPDGSWSIKLIGFVV